MHVIGRTPPKMIARREIEFETEIQGLVLGVDATIWYVKRPVDTGEFVIEVESTEVGEVHLFHDGGGSFIIEKCLPYRMKDEFDRRFDKYTMALAYVLPLDFEAVD